MTYDVPLIRSSAGDDRADTVISIRSGLTALLASVTGSIGAFGVLPDQVQIRWAIASSPFTSPEFAPKLFVVVLFPALVATLAAVAHWLGKYLTDTGRAVTYRRSYRRAVLGTFGVVLGVQALVILANLT